MRKRCRRQHWTPAAHPLLAPTTPLADGELLELRLQEHQALDALSRASALRLHLHTLMTSAAAAQLLATKGYGIEHARRLREALQVLGACRKQDSGAIGLDAPGVELAAWMLAFHDAQREVVARADYLRALWAVGRHPGRWGICSA